MNRMRAGWVFISLAVGSVVVVGLVSMVVAAWTATQIRESQVNAVRTIDNTSQTLDLIRDCTDPKGECYQRGQASTAEAVDSIGLLSAYAAACADQPDQQTADEIQECVLELLNRPRPKHP